ncbi:MAG: DUF4136 domain-containing protein [Flavobacteriaceae bacterium]|nr:DUF4136 domain-containing protein [Flavobacteriaceae bacterium]
MRAVVVFLGLMLSLSTLTSCSSISVASDYDREIDFSQYKTFAFYKPGIDEVEISDLDKRRILRAIDRELTNKGMLKSPDPDLLINIFTEEHDYVNVWNDFGWGMGWGWGWGMGMPMHSVHRTTEGTLYIDLIDKKRNQLVWQGMGEGILSQRMDKKEAFINEIVTKILNRYPPKK